MIEVTCCVCDQPFQTDESYLRKCCSEKCLYALRSQIVLRRVEGPQWVTQTCQNCGKDFLCKKYRQNRSKYCSPECSYNDRTKTRDFQRQEYIYSLYISGNTMREIGKLCQLSYQRISQILDKREKLLLLQKAKQLEGDLILQAREKEQKAQSDFIQTLQWRITTINSYSVDLVDKKEKVYWHKTNGMSSPPIPALVLKYHPQKVQIAIHNTYFDTVMVKNVDLEKLTPRIENALIDERWKRDGISPEWDAWRKLKGFYDQKLPIRL